MPSATMWWARTDWSTPAGVNAALGAGGLQVAGSVIGAPSGFLSLGERRASFRVLGQFWLGTDRMPTGGCVFQSAPNAHITGEVAGTTFGGIWPFGPWPTTTCSLMARQLVFSGGALIASSQSDTEVISFVDQEWQFARTTIRSNPFFPVTFDLNRQRGLAIRLELLFHMFLRGTGSVRFSPFADSLPFLIGLHQWDIVSIT